MKVKSQEVGFGESLAYLFANLGNIPLMTLLSSFFLIFYTNVVGLDPAKLATLFLISKVVDGLSDPFMGFLLDRFPATKMGKFRPMLILGTIICAINYILLWFGAVWIPAGKYVIVYITYLLLGITFDIMDISLNGMLPVITANPEERNKLSVIKAVGYTAGSILLGIVGPLVVANATLESYYTLIFGATAFVVIASVGGALGVKERVSFENKEEEKYNIKDLFKILFTKPVFVFFMANFLYYVGMITAMSADAYFYTYIMGDMTIMSAISMIALVGTVPGMILSPIFANKLGKKKVFVTGLMFTVLGTAVRLIAPTNLALLYVASIVSKFGAGLVTPLSYGIQADNTTYIQYTTGKRAEAAVASLSSFITKASQGIAGALPGYLLAAFGFVTGAASQPESINTGILIAALGVPIICGALGAVIFGFGYKIEKQDVEDMAVAINAGKAEE